MSYITSGREIEDDSLHIAYSTTGLRWTELGLGRSVFRLAGLGSGHLRDPYIYRKRDGTFVLLASDWTRAQNDADYFNRPSPSIVVADSTDLYTFSNVRLLQVTDLAGPGGMAMGAIAPEAFYDQEDDRYGIYWTGVDENGDSRIYVSYTRDFITIDNRTPEVYFDPDYDVSDASFVRHEGSHYMFYRDATNNSATSSTGSGQDIQLARSEVGTLDAESFERLDLDYIPRGTEQGSRVGTASPFVVRASDLSEWYMCAELTDSLGSPQCWSNVDIAADTSTWVSVSSDRVSMPNDAVRPNVVGISQTELEALLGRYGQRSAYRLRTSYSENNNPFYVVQSVGHATMTYLNDASTGAEAVSDDDFLWKLVPGLADPSDPDLVSFESLAQPGYFLRVNQTRPYLLTCTTVTVHPSNHGEFVCDVAAEDRPYLLWLEEYVDADAFRDNATFRRTTALSGNANAVSFQWYTDASRYIRHSSFQVLSLPLDGSTANQEEDASFILEEVPLTLE